MEMNVEISEGISEKFGIYEKSDRIVPGTKTAVGCGTA
jgi:hypothetical protein